ncbi:MAG: glutamine amidotransferase [Myxococcota bacterium]
MTLLHPWAIALLGIVAAGSWWVWRKRSGPGVLVRAVVLSILCFAAARPVVFWSDPPEVTIYALDTSQSVPLKEQRRALQDIEGRRHEAALLAPSGLLYFSDAPQIVDAIGDNSGLPPLTDPGTTSDLAAAIHQGIAMLPDDRDGTLVLYTDGRGNAGDLDRALSAATSRGVRIEAIALDPARPEPDFATIQLEPDTAAPGEPIHGTVSVHGGDEGISGLISVTAGDEELATVEITVPAGETAGASFEGALPSDLEEGPTRITATLGDATISAQLMIQPPPKVLLVGARRGDLAPLEAALAADGVETERRHPRQTPDSLKGIDLVVLANTPTKADAPERLRPGFVSLLDAYVSDGGGLIVLGGDSAYDLGGWQDSRLSSLLPVEIDPDGALKEDAVTLVIALDKSGSMARSAAPVNEAVSMVGGVTARLTGGRPVGSKIRLADEGAIAAMKLMRRTDEIGVLAVDTEARWAVPIQPIANQGAIKTRILQIAAGGGGIYLLDTMDVAIKALRQASTPLRHLVLFLDAEDVGQRTAPGRSALKLAEKLQEEEITLSVIGIGSDDSRDAEFLQDLADRGGGRLHLTDDARELPALFTQETEELLGLGFEEDKMLRARLERWHPALQGIDWAGAPSLRGRNRVNRRARSRVLLTVGDDRAPLLSVWRYGLGEVAAFTSDAGSLWATRWLRWDGYGALWVQLSRSLARGSINTADAIAVTTDGTQATVSLTLIRGDGLSEDAPGLSLTATQGDATQTIPLTVTSPGTWAGTVKAPPGSDWSFAFSDADGQILATRAWAAPPTPERRFRTADQDTLDRLNAVSGGERTERSKQAVALAPWLMVLAALLLPIDAFARRRQRFRGR